MQHAAVLSVSTVLATGALAAFAALGTGPPAFAAAEPSVAPVGAASTATAPSDAIAPERPEVSVTATIPESPIVPGRPATIRLDLDISGEGWTSASDTAPGVMLQIDPPPGLTLAGAVIEDPRQLARNEFLEEPFERTIEPTGATIEFSVDEALADDATIGLNVLVHLSGPEAADRLFVRRRVDVPVAAGATASSDTDAATSSWHRSDRGLLAIGDRADAIVLDQAGGEPLDLSTMVGERPIVITTYRAFW